MFVFKSQSWLPAMYRTLRKITVERKTLGEKCLKQSSNNKNNQLENYFVNFFNQKSLQSFTWKTPNNLCLGVITWRVGYFCGDLSPSKSSLFFDRNLICFLQSYMNSALTAQKTIFFVVDSPQNQGRWLEKNSHLPGPSPTKPTPPVIPAPCVSPAGLSLGFAGTTCPTLKTTASPPWNLPVFTRWHRC